MRVIHHHACGTRKGLKWWRAPKKSPHLAPKSEKTGLSHIQKTHCLLPHQYSFLFRVMIVVKPWACWWGVAGESDKDAMHRWSKECDQDVVDSTDYSAKNPLLLPSPSSSPICQHCCGAQGVHRGPLRWWWEVSRKRWDSHISHVV